MGDISVTESPDLRLTRAGDFREDYENGRTYYQENDPINLNIMKLAITYYYRLTNNYLGANMALDVNPNGSGRLMMAAVCAFSGQCWKPVDRAGASTLSARSISATICRWI